MSEDGASDAENAVFIRGDSELPSFALIDCHRITSEKKISGLMIVLSCSTFTSGNPCSYWSTRQAKGLLDIILLPVLFWVLSSLSEQVDCQHRIFL
jgi:hypothetical protein